MEVGSGDKPYPRSDVLLDKYFSDSSEREAKKALKVDRPLVIGEVEHLPFRPKSFDYIIASHVLEHAQNPQNFLEELMRVGKRGYIETPLPLRERINNWSFHRWYVFPKRNKLILIRKTHKSQVFHTQLSAGIRKEYRILEGKTLLNMKFEWQDRIRYKIFLQEPHKFLNQLDRKLIQMHVLLKKMQSNQQRLHPVQWLKDTLFPIKFGISQSLESLDRNRHIRLLSLIVCPQCKKELELRNDRLLCFSCQVSYHYRKSLPIFTQVRPIRLAKYF